MIFILMKIKMMIIILENYQWFWLWWYWFRFLVASGERELLQRELPPSAKWTPKTQGIAGVQGIIAREEEWSRTWPLFAD